MNFKHPTIQPTNQGQNTYEEHAWNCKETQLTTMKHRQTTNQTTNQDKQINFKTTNGKQGNTWNTMEQQCHTSSKQPTNQPTKQAMKGNENDEENGNSHKNKTTTKKHKQTTNQPTNRILYNNKKCLTTQSVLTQMPPVPVTSPPFFLLTAHAHSI